MAAPCGSLERQRERDLPGEGTAMAPPQGGQDVGVVRMLRLRDNMKQKLMEFSAALRRDQENFPDHIVEEKLTESTTEELQGHIEETEVSLQNKMLALQRIQLMAALRHKVNKDDKDSCLILETVKSIMLLSRTIIKYKQQAREKEHQLAELKRKRLSLKKEEEQKVQKIQSMKKKQKQEQGNTNLIEPRILSNLEKERAITTVIQNVFQNIILGSGVNWAEDPSLKTVVLQLEKNVQRQ